MTHTHACFLLPSGTTPTRLIELLEDDVRLQPDGADRLRSWYLDSFDWRLHRAGAVLGCEAQSDQARLELRDPGKTQVLTRATAAQTPTWPSDIDAGPLRDRIEALLEMRVLLPLVEIDRKVHRYRVLNEDDKTVAWLRCEEPRCRTPGRRESHALPPRVSLDPVRGYDRETALVAERLRGVADLPPAPALPFDEALAAIGRTPGDYSSKISVELAPATPALEAACAIFRQLLGTLEANIDGTRKDLDSEFLHDLRVATRRTRSALSQIKGILAPPVLEDFKRRFAWLGQVTGPTRDLDVFLLTFPDYLRQVPSVQRPALAPLHDFLAAHQQHEQAVLKRKLGSPHFRRLLRDWRALLNDMPTPDSALQPNAGRDVKTVADERIWRMFRRVLKEGRAIDDASANADLHELRKSCKKLRYLIEFFQSLYGSDAKLLVTALKRLLDNLGEFQDLEVQADRLAHFAEQMQAEAEVPVPTLLAIGGLVSELLRRQDRARAEFAARFAEFDSKGNRTAYRRLFKAAPA